MKLDSLIRKISVIGLLLLTGCATIYGRQNDQTPVHFISNVEGVTVDCEGKAVQTPGNLELTQSQTHRCTASKEGFTSQTFRVMTVLSKEGFDYSTDVNMQKWGKWTLGIGAVIGWGVDFISGSMRSLEKDRYVIEMKSVEDSTVPKKVLEKTGEITKTLVLMPAEIVDGTTSTVMDKTIRKPSEAVGLVGENTRQEAEDVIEGKKLADRLEAQTTPEAAHA